MENNKKVTIRDVAKFVGVSTATISYIMNDRYDVKIKEETRKKVKQAANILNYIPNHTAQSLATGHANIVGIAYRLDSSSPTKNMEIMNFVNLIIQQLSRMHYCVTFIPLENDSTLYKKQNFLQTVSAIIVIDLMDEQFHAFADNFYVPIISVDILINDFLFYQIYTDYTNALKKAINITGDNYTVIMDEFYNRAYQDFITQNIPNDKLLLFSKSTFKQIKSLPDKKYIIIGTQLALFLKSYLNKDQMIVLATGNEDTCLSEIPHVIPMDIEKKVSLTVNIMLNSIERKFSVAHQYPVGAISDM